MTRMVHICHFAQALGIHASGVSSYFLFSRLRLLGCEEPFSDVSNTTTSTLPSRRSENE